MSPGLKLLCSQIAFLAMHVSVVSSNISKSFTKAVMMEIAESKEKIELKAWGN